MERRVLRLHIVTTMPLGGKHQQKIRESFPEIRISVCRGVEEALPYLGDAEIVATYGEDLTEEILEHCGTLRWIQVFSAGLDQMPFAAIRRRGILVTNARGIHAIPMAEYTMGAVLQHARRSLAFYEQQKRSEWNRSLRVDEIYGKTMGIIGTGAIGSEIGKRAKAFGMETLGVNTDGRPVPGIDRCYPRERLEEVLALSDYVVVVVPSTAETRGMLNARCLQRMKPGAVLVNIARGDVVDEPALVRALREGWIGGAVLDVFAEEPLPPDHPFWQCPRCVITPHMSGRSPRYMERAMEIFLHNLQIWREWSGMGHPAGMVNVVDLERGY